MPSVPIPEPLQQALHDQVNQELAAAHGYTALAVWCYRMNLKGFSRFFDRQAGEERGHARRVMDHLMARGVAPRLDALPAPPGDFDSILAVAHRARDMEASNTAAIHAAYATATSAGDVAGQVMLQWFVSEQVEEEDWTQEMVERVVRANCAGAISELDRHIERYLDEGFFEEPPA